MEYWNEIDFANVLRKDIPSNDWISALLLSRCPKVVMGSLFSVAVVPVSNMDFGCIPLEWLWTSIYKLAGLAVFRGRLMSFQMCTAGVASLKGKQNLESMLLTFWEKQYFTPVLTCSYLFTPVHTCSHLRDYLRSSHHDSYSLNFPLVKVFFLYLTSYLAEIA